MTSKVLDFTKKRTENIEQKRRSFERIVFNNFLGAYATLDEEGAIYPISLVDISKDGCMFQIPWDKKKDDVFEMESEKTFRMYFTKDSYIPVFVKIKYASEYIENGEAFMRYGCEFDKETPSFKSIESFINFMYEFAEHSVIDKGDQKVFFL